MPDTPIVLRVVPQPDAFVVAVFIKHQQKMESLTTAVIFAVGQETVDGRLPSGVHLYYALNLNPNDR